MPLASATDLAIFERGWLSSNNVLLHGRDGEGTTLVDTGHCLHAAQTEALVRHALPPGGRRCQHRSLLTGLRIQSRQLDAA